MGNLNTTVLAIQAHPDDTEIFCAGTLALLKQKGFKIVIATMTPGGMGGVTHDEKGTAKIRGEEATRAAAILDAEYYCLEQRDGYVFDNTEARIAVTSLIQKVKADVVFTHLPFDYHPDHRATSYIVEAGTILATLPNVPTEETPLKRTPLLYYTSPFGFTNNMGGKITDPSFFVDITSTFEKKKEMLSFHESQKKVMELMFNIADFFEDMRDSDQNMGKIAGVRYAEAYWQNTGGGFPKDPLIQKILKEYRR
ncbi:MAG: PIG-L family deacetylase [Spirochaetia bacterium]|jgi:LmbE family N-acetylglucosaminyl deacetylase|nr:PIG-L family deacetylase [Spirochaetia bacterium]